MRRFVLTAVTLFATSLQAQEGGTVTGRVTDQATGSGIPRVSVSITGTAIQTVANDSGFFRIRRVPVGSQVLRAIRIGYLANTATVAVTEGGTVNADIALTPAATVLTNVVITATGQEKESREVATFTPTITPDSMNLTASPNFASVLEASAPGVQVTQSSGTLGAGARVRIRGSSSVSLSNEPLYVIDGVEVDNNPNGFGTSNLSIAVGGQQPSRLNDINPDDIESLQTLQGPAATGLYGTAAANGVVIITTKHGRAGAQHWDAFVENGEIHDQNNYPANFGSWSVPKPGAADALSPTGGGCVIWLEAAGSCHIDSVTSYSPIHGTITPLRVGRSQEYNLSTNGGSDINQYFVSGDYTNQTGTDNVNQLIRTTGRGNFSTRPRQDLSLAMSAGYTSSNTRFPQNDNDVLGVVSDALLGRGYGGAAYNYGYYSDLNPAQTANIHTFEDVQRFTPSLTANYSPLSWFNANATAGFDLASIDDQNNVAANLVPFGNDALGLAARNRLEDETYTLNLNATATSHLPQNVTSTSTIGGSWRRVLNTGTYTFGVGLPGGSNSLNGASQQVQIGQLDQDSRVIGGFIQQQFGWRDVLFVSGGVRLDKNSSTGVAAGTTAYPTGQVSYVLSDESWFPKPKVMDALKLRVAVGQSGLHPDFLDALTFKNPVVAVSPEGGTVPSTTAGNPGNQNLKPERTTEVETGFDLSMFRDRLSLGLTYYDKHTTDALIQQVLPGSFGDTTFRWINIGKVRNRGLELQTTADVVKMRQADFTIVANFSTLENRLQDLGTTNGQPNAPIIFGLGGATQEHAQGFPLGGYWQLPYTYTVSANGVVEKQDVTVGKTRVYMGSSLPTANASLSPQLTLFKLIRVSSLFDFQGGNKLYDGTEDFRCGQFFNCQSDFVKTNPATEAANIADHYYATVAGFIQDATFWKWREAAISLLLPAEYARKIFARGATITFAARNLRVWTKYPGLDPELAENGQAGATNGFTAADFLTQPPVRYYTFRVTLNY